MTFSAFLLVKTSSIKIIDSKRFYLLVTRMLEKTQVKKEWLVRCLKTAPDKL